MRRNTVDQGVEEREDDISRQLCSFRHCSRHDGGCCGGKGHLKDKGGEENTHHFFWGVYKEVPDSTERVGVFAVSKTQTKPKHPVRQSAEHHVHHVLDHDVHFVLAGNIASF